MRARSFLIVTLAFPKFMRMCALAGVPQDNTDRSVNAFHVHHEKEGGASSIPLLIEHQQLSRHFSNVLQDSGLH